MKTLYIIGTITVLLVGGVGYGVWTMKQAVTPETTGPVPAVVVATSSDATTTDQISGQGTLQSLLALGKTLECSFRMSGDMMTTEGTAFFDDGKLRVDTMYAGTSSVADTSSLIINGDTMYTWVKTDAGEFAIKMPMSAVPQVQAQSRKGEVSLQNNVQYDCKSWHVDGSVFVPPATITFMDMGSMMKGIPSGMMMKVPQTPQ